MTLVEEKQKEQTEPSVKTRDWNLVGGYWEEVEQGHKLPTTICQLFCLYILGSKPTHISVSEVPQLQQLFLWEDNWVDRSEQVQRNRLPRAPQLLLWKSKEAQRSVPTFGRQPGRSSFGAILDPKLDFKNCEQYQTKFWTVCLRNQTKCWKFCFRIQTKCWQSVSATWRSVGRSVFTSRRGAGQSVFTSRRSVGRSVLAFSRSVGESVWKTGDANL